MYKTDSPVVETIAEDEDLTGPDDPDDDSLEDEHTEGSASKHEGDLKEIEGKPPHFPMKTISY
jgi:hypothetical protein